MQTIKILNRIWDINTPDNEKNTIDIFEANNISYRWYKMNEDEYISFLKDRAEIYIPFDYETYFKRRKDSGMSPEITFCYLYFYDIATDQFKSFVLVDSTVFIMNSAGQTIDKIYS